MNHPAKVLTIRVQIPAHRSGDGLTGDDVSMAIFETLGQRRDDFAEKESGTLRDLNGEPIGTWAVEVAS